jgi:hypothetical protein
VTLTRQESPATRSSDETTSPGLGSADIKVKGKRATAKQRETIDGVLTQAQEDNASKRVMQAAIMTITQESRAGEDVQKTGNDDTGIYQQGRNWVTEEESKQAGPSTHAFLITGPTSWKKVHGGVKKAPGNLSLAIHQVQGNKDPNAYAQWEDEALNTVETWLADGGNSEDTYTKSYEFTRGDRQGSRENSWDASARLVGDVGAYRWAVGNVFHAVSGDELRAQKASLTIRGDEPWLVSPPAWSWANAREITEVTMVVLADRWDLMPGAAVVLVDEFGIVAGRWLVWNTSGDRLDSPVATVVLRRPTRIKSEPPAETGQREAGTGDLEGICRQISDNRHEYVYGGSHGPKLSKLSPSSPFDCSSSTSYALKKAGLFSDDVAWTSGKFASSYGKAGKGDEFTVWANGGHVWIEGYEDDGSFAWRFDTSQHSGKSGPMLTTVARHDQGRFTARHWPGH